MSKIKEHSYKVRGPVFIGGLWGSFLIQRVVGAWNGLPLLVVEVDMTVTLKRILN